MTPPAPATAPVDRSETVGADPSDRSDMRDDGPVALALAYLLSARLGDDEQGRRSRDGLARLDEAELDEGLPDDATRLAFWIDLYNGAALRQTDARLGSWRGRMGFLRRPVVTVAGETLSLSRIEDGILRRNRARYGGGYLPALRPPAFDRRHAVERIDARIHFALNYAAASCPPIAAYEPERIEPQLDLATRSYLTSTIELEEDVARVPSLFLWFRGDFRDAGGARRFIESHGVALGDRKLRFLAWDWTPTPGRWIGDSDADEP